MPTDYTCNQKSLPFPGGFGRGQAERLAFGTLFVYFIAKAVFFALRIRERLFPDEATWYGIIQIFSRSNWLPVDSPESYPLGLITHTPSLYFFLMGKLLACNVFAIDDLIFLRLANVALAMLTVLFAWRLAKRLELSLPVRIIFLIMLTNTVMFTFVSGAVSYDNLSTLLAVLSLYYFVCFFHNRSRSHLLLFFLCLLSGMLTKVVLIPYGAALLLMFLFYERGNLVIFLQSIPSSCQGWRWVETLLLVLCFLALAMNLTLYGGNKIRFGGLLPNMDMVVPIEGCLQNRLFVRNYVVREFKSGKLTLVDAQRLALSIRDPGDRASALNQLREATKKNQAPKQLQGRWRYALEWGKVMVMRTYSVAAHLSLFKYESDFYAYYAIFALTGGLWLFRFRDFCTPCMAGIGFTFLLYTTILMQVVNYGNYRGTGFSGLALTGRYMFPVLIPLYLLSAQALLAKMPRWWQLLVGLTVAVIFIGGEFPWFLRMAGPEWYFPKG